MLLPQAGGGISSCVGTYGFMRAKIDPACVRAFLSLKLKRLDHLRVLQQGVYDETSYEFEYSLYINIICMFNDFDDNNL